MTAEELYERHKDRVFRLCLRFCSGDIGMAEDITQDVFMKMLEQLDTLQALDKLEPWFYRVTTNMCFTRLQRERTMWKKLQQILVPEVGHVRDTPEHHIQVKEELQEIDAKLRALPPKERVVFCMVYLDECSQAQVCEMLSLSKGYVSKLLQRAQSRLTQKGWDLSHV
ncbi:MAG TPA: sigma-70 family RNA polymerase sigma factor [Myxococcales bacterium]|nr:RNA polymerase subunit sigma [Deltaproteobacteria bacterium]HAA57300.1 sigma-70 family RNA polymerase sigma factor [Myxococcales bacterium]|tara:strand:+ start:3602 stop:4105 length:504 start_codon:yes stop_codon:yes gene_type:complete